MSPLVAHRDAIAAGVFPGPRVAYGGFQFYSDWPFDEEPGRGVEPPADTDHIRRAVALAEAFGARTSKRERVVDRSAILKVMRSK